jgi:hypothetical protein
MGILLLAWESNHNKRLAATVRKQAHSVSMVKENTRYGIFRNGCCAFA